MSEFQEIFNLRSSKANISNPKFSKIFQFPYTDDYCHWVDIESQTFPTGRKPRFFWTDFYGEIIKREIKPAGVEIPAEWYKKIISFPTKSVYVIADVDENILYIGKCEFTPVIRILDRMIPKELNQMNNVPEIWNDYLIKGHKVKCRFVYNLDFNPKILESFLLRKYKSQNGALPKFNKVGS